MSDRDARFCILKTMNRIISILFDDEKDSGMVYFLDEFPRIPSDEELLQKADSETDMHRICSWFFNYALRFFDDNRIEAIKDKDTLIELINSMDSLMQLFPRKYYAKWTESFPDFNSTSVEELQQTVSTFFSLAYQTCRTEELWLGEFCEDINMLEKQPVPFYTFRAMDTIINALSSEDAHTQWQDACTQKSLDKPDDMHDVMDEFISILSAYHPFGFDTASHPEWIIHMFHVFMVSMDDSIRSLWNLDYRIAETKTADKAEQVDTLAPVFIRLALTEKYK